MGMNDTPSAERVHIGFFGRRNAGKSSVVNAVTGQDLAVVSSTKGTTTDPVTKSMELLPLGPVVIIDTPGFDDEGALGEKRVHKTRQTLNRCDMAVLVVDATLGLGDCERELIGLFRAQQIPYLVALNKSDLMGETGLGGMAPRGEGLRGVEPGEKRVPSKVDGGNGTPLPRSSVPCGTELPRSSVPLASERNTVLVSAKTGAGINELKERIAALGRAGETDRCLVRDLLSLGDVVVLVIPIDKAAPKGRLILPQQMMIRDILDADAEAVVVKEGRLAATLDRMLRAGTPPRMVITDSQVFGKVSKVVPPEVPLTSFSILMARYKGLLAGAVRGAAAIDRLRDGDVVLVSEGCTHHRQCGDIGTVKIPRWLAERTGRDLRIQTSSGRDFPEDLSSYALVIHCGGCMLNGREMTHRMRASAAQGVPMTNYGTAIAYMKGILPRSVALFPSIAAELA